MKSKAAKKRSVMNCSQIAQYVNIKIRYIDDEAVGICRAVENVLLIVAVATMWTLTDQ